MRLHSRLFIALLALCLCALPARAAFHLYVIAEVYSSADGSVQFIRMHTASSGQQFLAGQTITFTSGATTHTYTFPSNAGSPTTNTDLLIATANFGSLSGGVSPDFPSAPLPANFILNTGGTLQFSGGSSVTFGQLPTNGSQSINAAGTPMTNTPRNFNGQSGSVNVPGGSCCNGAACSLALQSACTGTFSLGGVCSPNPCGGPPTGGCCATNGGCSVVIQSSCTGPWVQGGTCSPNTCPQPGICCNGTSCTFVLQLACTGTWTAGAGCVAQSCQPAQGACCAGVTCRMDVAANCAGPRMVFTGAAACNATAQSTVPCCRADYNRIAGLNVADIFDYLNGWFAGLLDTDYLNNGAGPLSVQSIFGFINGWFAGCP